MAENTPVTVHRNERVLAFIIAASIGLSIVAILAMVIGELAGVDEGAGVWPAIVVLPLIGIPLGFLLMIVLLVVSVIRRSRAARDA